MAEIVHRNLESMLPQLEELESSGIFSHDEIKQIVRRRRNHEYKLLRRPARKEDFLAAVQYEMHLDQLRQHRKKKLGVAGTKQDAEYGIQNRVHSLFSRALKKFKGDLKLWLQHIEYSKQCGHKVSLSRTYGRALAVHPNNPGLWVSAAKFEFEEMKDISSARALLQQGLRANPHSQHLWIEYFRMELLHTDKVKKRQAVLGVDNSVGVASGEGAESMSDEFLAYKAASLVYSQAVASIPDDVEFRLSFLPIYRLFSETTPLQDEVFRDVQAAFPTHPLVWQALALRGWEGLDTPLSEAQTKELETKTESVFRDGITSASGAPCLTEHWTNYIRWCQERVKEVGSSDQLRKKAIRRMLSAFKEASQDGHLSETAFIEYVDILFDLGLMQEAADVSCHGTTAHPVSLGLWMKRLACLTALHCSVKELWCLGREALEKVPREKALQIWEFLIDYTLASDSREEEIEQCFKSGLQSGTPTVVDAVSKRYLEWSLNVGGAKKARKVYKRWLADRQPASWSLYQHCIQMEKKVLVDNPEGSLKHLRELYQQALMYYGSTQPDLWLGAIELEQSSPGGKVEDVGTLHWRAIKTLKPELTADFVSSYSLVQNRSAVAS